MVVKPKLALIPSGVKASKVYSVLPSNGVGDFDFSRSGEATRINKDGLIETVDSNVPRLNYPLIEGEVSGCPSLLLEPQRTNEWFYSEDFLNSNWIKTNVTISGNSIISPDGTLTASKIIDNSTSGEHRIRGNAVFISSGANFSIFAKAGEYNKFAIANLSDLHLIKFDLSNGTIISTGTGWSDAKIENYGNGWYRLSGNISTNKTCGYGLLNDDEDFVFSGTGSKGVYIWGAQFENNSSYPTSYIPTNVSSVTRSAETCNGAGDANTFNDSEGVLMAEISALDDDITNRIISLSNGTNNNIISVQFSNAQSNDIIAYYNATGQTGRVISTTSYNIKSFNKTALVWNNSSFKFYVNGYLIGSTTIETPLVDGTLNQLKFQYGNSTLPFYGNTKQIQYFNTALTDTDLEELTSWQSFNEMATAQLYKTY